MEAMLKVKLDGLRHAAQALIESANRMERDLLDSRIPVPFQTDNCQYWASAVQSWSQLSCGQIAQMRQDMEICIAATKALSQ